VCVCVCERESESERERECVITAALFSPAECRHNVPAEKSIKNLHAVSPLLANALQRYGAGGRGGGGADTASLFNDDDADENDGDD